MRGARYGTAVAVGFILMASTPIIGQSGMMGPGPMEPPGAMREAPPRGPSAMMGSGMMGMMESGGMGGHRDLMEPGPMLRMLKTELALSEGQEKPLKDILYQVAKAHIKQRADVRVAELELQQLLEADPVEMGKVEAKVKEVEGLRTALRLNWIKADEQAKSLLTPEQRQKLEHIHDRLHGMRGMRGEGGMGRMEMMGPQRLSGMSGGGTEGHVQSAQGAAGTQPLTQEDTQGGVTVSATLLTPDKPRPDATLAVQVTLVLRGIGGVPERVFQWPLGAGARR